MVLKNKHHYWIALHHDIKRPIGGVKQIHRLAEAISVNGRNATIIQSDANFHPGWFKSKVSTISLSEWKKIQTLDPTKDIIILPETFLPGLPNYRPDLPKIIFNQNGSYSFGFQKGDGFPKNPEKILSLYNSPELLQTLCVSKFYHLLLSVYFGLGEEKVSKITNPIETEVFVPSGNKKRMLSYMPRKNSKDASIVVSLLKNSAWFQEWELCKIDRMSQDEVRKTLQKSLGFLSFGHPEGFGLPLAEAAACGCALIGYSGLGGKEIFTLARENNVGWEVDFGDWGGFVSGASDLNSLLVLNQENLSSNLYNLSKQVRNTYSKQNMESSVKTALQKCEKILESSTKIHAYNN